MQPTPLCRRPPLRPLRPERASKLESFLLEPLPASVPEVAESPLTESDLGGFAGGGRGRGPRRSLDQPGATPETSGGPTEPVSSRACRGDGPASGATPPR